MNVTSINGLLEHLRARVSAVLQELGVDDRPALTAPPDTEFGDLGLACFPLAQKLRKAPQKIAEDVAQRLHPDDVLASARPVQGYVNLTFSTSALARVVLGEALERGDSFAGAGVAAPRRFVVEYSAPNTNKPLHLGHVRNNVLGLSVTRLLRHVGHDVVAVNLINDRGVHICKSMLAYERWGDGATPQSAGKKGDFLVGHFYVEFERRFSAEYQAWLQTPAAADEREAWLRTAAGRKSKDPAKDFASDFRDEYFNRLSPLGAEAREMLRRWEGEDPGVRALWRRMNGWVYDGFNATYNRMGVAFDKVYYESETYRFGKEIVEDGLREGLFRRLADGAVVCDYARLGIDATEGAYKVLLRADGTSVYTTQDLGTAIRRHDEFGFERMVYVVGDEQRHHFTVLFALLALLRPQLRDACFHLAYGMVNLPEGKMKSREGKVVDADTLMDEMAALAREELQQRADAGRAHAEALDEREIALRAERIAQAAIKFHLLSFAAASTIRFDPRKSIDFLGKTGPYCLNAYARTRSLLRRAGGEPALSDAAATALTTERERAVLKALFAFPARLQAAADGLDPVKLSDATFDVARAFNQMYTDKEGHPIEKCADTDLRTGRLLLALAVGHALRVGLRLLGIEPLEEM